MSDRIWSDMGDGARDVAGHALSDIQNHWQQFHTGRLAPLAAMPGVMETTTETDPLIGPPESMSTALLKHGAAVGLETEADHWRDYNENYEEIPDIEPGVTGWERYSAMTDTSQPAQGPSASAPTPEPGAPAYEPEI